MTAATESDEPAEDLDVLVDLFEAAMFTPWQERALCKETDPDAFFPEKGGSTREAKRVCQSCEVRSECLESALANGEPFGIWGGLSERERRKLIRRAGTPSKLRQEREAAQETAKGLFAQGWRKSDIARKLGLSDTTIGKYINAPSREDTAA